MHNLNVPSHNLQPMPLATQEEFTLTTSVAAFQTAAACYYISAFKGQASPNPSTSSLTGCVPSGLTILATSLKIFIEGEGQMPNTASGRTSAVSKRNYNSIAQSADQTTFVELRRQLVLFIDGDGTGGHQYLQVLHRRAADPPARSQPLWIGCFQGRHQLYFCL